MINAKYFIMVLVVGLLSGCVSNKRLYCGVEDLGDTSKYHQEMKTTRRAK
jgi:hypothetical protein